MNNNRKSELKQSVIAALSTFPCPVTVPEILHKLDRLDHSNLTRPELTELLEEITSEGEAEKFPVNRYACHHIWTSTNKERRCSRCHRVEPVKPIEPAIIPEIIDNQELELDSLNTLQQEKEELLRIESELRTHSRGLYRQIW